MGGKKGKKDLSKKGSKAADSRYDEQVDAESVVPKSEAGAPALEEAKSEAPAVDINPDQIGGMADQDGDQD